MSNEPNHPYAHIAEDSEDPRLEVLRSMRETWHRQKETVRSFVANAEDVLRRLQAAQQLDLADPFHLLGASDDRRSEASEPVRDVAARDEGAVAPDHEAVLAAAAEALSAVAATEAACSDQIGVGAGEVRNEDR